RGERTTNYPNVVLHDAAAEDYRAGVRNRWRPPCTGIGVAILCLRDKPVRLPVVPLDSRLAGVPRAREDIARNRPHASWSVEPIPTGTQRQTQPTIDVNGVESALHRLPAGAAIVILRCGRSVRVVGTELAVRVRRILIAVKRGPVARR